MSSTAVNTEKKNNNIETETKTCAEKRSTIKNALIIMLPVIIATAMVILLDIDMVLIVIGALGSVWLLLHTLKKEGKIEIHKHEPKEHEY